MAIKTTERGWAGHFICSHYCQFRRNTLVENDETGFGIVVSTVGCMFNLNSMKAYAAGKLSEREPEEIGHNRMYETMCFVADKSIYRDSDVTQQVSIMGPDLKWSIDYHEWENNKDRVDNIANQMHEDMVSQVQMSILRLDQEHQANKKQEERYAIES